ncbi:hypothetical protein PR048_004567 [Dryococelus australis]|uniref:DDE-1 domain-containing protein n=1 Tax=Dryococelus australis TaxID=614101 RepID=A0ABQ9I5S6_9NEOP|nr:hypothetical protein PR048_004567 [Dryococelus australis]
MLLVKNVLQGKHYSIPLGTLSNKVRKKHTNSIGRPLLSFVEHFIQVTEWGFPFDTLDLRMMASAYLNIQGCTVPCFKNNIPSSDWVLAFLKRHRAKISKRMGRNIRTSSASLSEKLSEQYFDCLAVTVMTEDGSNVSPTNIFNYDETNLFDDPGQNNAFLRDKYFEAVSKVQYPLCFVVQYVFLCCLHMLAIKQNIYDPLVQKVVLEDTMQLQQGSWFDIVTFSDWFETVFVPHVKGIQGKKLIIGDNPSSNSANASTRKHRIPCLPANSTHLLQPLDVAFYGPLKRYWRNVLDA